jgi:hypothetical protein
MVVASWPEAGGVGSGIKKEGNEYNSVVYVVACVEKWFK